MGIKQLGQAARVVKRAVHGVEQRQIAQLVPSKFSSVELPIFGSTTDKFRQLYPLRLVKILSRISVGAYLPAVLERLM